MSTDVQYICRSAIERCSTVLIGDVSMAMMVHPGPRETVAATSLATRQHLEPHQMVPGIVTRGGLLANRTVGRSGPAGGAR